MSQQYLDPLTIKDIEISSPSASNQYYNDKYSRAYANAMRALQDKIRSLESENGYLKDKIASIETKSSFDSKKWQDRLSEETKIWSQKEKYFQNTNFSLEHKIKDLSEKILILEEKLRIKDDQIWHQSSQEKMNYEQFSLDRENFNLEIEILKRKLSNEINDHKNNSNMMMRIDKEKKMLEEENFQLRRVNGILEEEIESIKESAKNQKINPHEDLENESAKMNIYIEKIKELEYKNKCLNDTAENQKEQLEMLQREIENIYSSQKASTNPNIESLHSPSSRNKFSSYKEDQNSFKKQSKNKLESLHSPSNRKDLSPYKGSQKAKRLKKHISVKSIGHVKRPVSPLCEDCAQKEDGKPLKSSLKMKPSLKSVSGLVRVNEPQEDEIADSILRLENEISFLGKKYKQLLHSSQEEASDLGILRQEITETSTEIQKKSDALYELKRKRHAMLRDNLAA